MTDGDGTDIVGLDSGTELLPIAFSEQASSTVMSVQLTKPIDRVLFGDKLPWGKHVRIQGHRK